MLWSAVYEAKLANIGACRAMLWLISVGNQARSEGNAKSYSSAHTDNGEFQQHRQTFDDFQQHAQTIGDCQQHIQTIGYYQQYVQTIGNNQQHVQMIGNFQQHVQAIGNYQ